jgi:hypothetical protein
MTFKRSKLDLGFASDEPCIKLALPGVATVAVLHGNGFAYLKLG